VSRVIKFSERIVMGSKLDPEIKRWRAIEPNRHLIRTPYSKNIGGAMSVKWKKIRNGLGVLGK